jgi:lactoylglutathione lyase
MRLEHVAIWVRDLEWLRDFYVLVLGGESGSLYENPRTGFRSYFISFGEGARLELMSRPADQAEHRSQDDHSLGYAHVAFRLGTREAVDVMVARLEAQGRGILERPRVTGDGYYEAIIADPEGNTIELVA